VIGVDVAPAMTALASAIHPDLSFAVGAADDLPFGDRSFDVALLGFVLLHVGRPLDALREARRVLVPGGRLGLTLWDEGESNALHASILGAVESVGAAPPSDLPPGPPGFYSDGALVTLLRNAGFTDVRVSHIGFDVAFRDAGEMWAGIMRAGVRFPPLVRSQPADVQARIRTAFERHVGQFSGPDGGLRVPTSIQVTVATSGGRREAAPPRPQHD
jgi:SAM-dependent methyltransferase